MTKTIILSAFLGVLVSIGFAVAEEVDIVKLEKKTWTFSMDKKWAELEALLAPGFQYVNQGGIHDAKGFMEACKASKQSDFTLSDFRITRKRSMIVMSYNAEVQEILAGKPLPKQKAPRSAVWIKTETSWLKILHANCNPICK